MKRKLLSVLLLILVVCLAGSLLIFTACDKDGKDDGGKKPDDGKKPISTEQKTDEMLLSVFENIANSYDVGKTFNIDIAGFYAYEDKAHAENNVKYTLEMKGNVDTTDPTVENGIDYLIEIKKIQGETTNRIFGMGYEAIDNQPYFYFSLLDSDYVKVNGYSMQALAAILKPAMDSVEGLVNQFSGMVANLLFGEKGNVKDGVYTFDFSLPGLMGRINTELLPVITGAIGEADLNNIIGTIFGKLSYEKEGVTVNVTSWATLMEYVNAELSGFAGQVIFNFDKDTLKFKDATAAFNLTNSGETDPVKTYTAKIEKVNLTVSETKVDTYAGFQWTADERKAESAINLVNYNITGTALGYNAAGEVLHTYSIALNADINPFALIDLIKGIQIKDIIDLVGKFSPDALIKYIDQKIGKDVIVNFLKELGYFNLTVNEVNADGSKKENILTIHSDFSQGYAIVNFDAYDLTYGSITAGVGLGGVYEFGATYDMIISVLANLFAPKPEAPAAAEIDINKILQDIIGMIDYQNMKENGVTLKTGQLTDYLLKMINQQSLRSTVMGIFGNAETINIKLNTPIYGQCVRVETSSIENTIKTNNAASPFLAQVTDVSGLNIPDKFEYGTTIGMLNGTIVGKDTAGNDYSTTGVLFGSTLDPTKVGSQKIKVFIGQDNEFSETLKMLEIDLPILGINFDMSVLHPFYGIFFGAFEYEMTVEVLPDESASATVTTNINKTEFWTSDTTVRFINQLAEGGQVRMTISGAKGDRTYDVGLDNMSILNAAGEDVTASVINAESGMIKPTAVGQYTLRFTYVQYKVDTVLKIRSKTLEASNMVSMPTAVKPGEEIPSPVLNYTDVDGVAHSAEPKSLVYTDAVNQTVEETAFTETVDGKKVISASTVHMNNLITATVKFDTSFGEVTETYYFWIYSDAPIFSSSLDSPVDWGFSLKDKVTLKYIDADLGILTASLKSSTEIKGSSLTKAVTVAVKDSSNADVTSTVLGGADGLVVKQNVTNGTYTLVITIDSVEYTKSFTINHVAQTEPTLVMRALPESGVPSGSTLVLTFDYTAADGSTKVYTLKWSEVFGTGAYILFDGGNPVDSQTGDPSGAWYGYNVVVTVTPILGTYNAETGVFTADAVNYMGVFAVSFTLNVEGKAFNFNIDQLAVMFA